MASGETNKVLSAIRSGEDSLPKLRLATGLDYAKLHPILHELEFEDRSIQRNENADGFDRYALMPKERLREHPADSTVYTIPPAALARTNAGRVAREMALVQRNAPYCASCRGLCFFVVDAEGRLQWRCRPCNTLFQGSTDFQMARIPIETEPKITAMRERDTIGPEEEAPIEEMRIAEEVLPDEPRERAVIELAKDDDTENHAPPTGNWEVFDNRCGCGYTANHRGRCADGQKKSARQDNVPTHCEKCGKSLAGQKKVNMNRCTACWSQYLKERAARRKKEQNGHMAKSDENITETITKSYGPFCEANCFPDKEIGHHRDCAYWKEVEARRTKAAKSEKTTTSPPTSNGHNEIADKVAHFAPSNEEPKHATRVNWAEISRMAVDEFREIQELLASKIDRLRKLHNVMLVCDDVPVPDLSVTAILNDLRTLDRQLRK